MTDMKRMTVSFKDEIAAELDRLKQTEEFKDKSYSQIINQLIMRGLAIEEKGA